MKIIHKIKLFYKTNENSIYITGLLALSVIVCFYNLGAKSFALDEVSTIGISTRWHSMLKLFATQEGNMWLYSFLMYFWLKLGQSEFIVRSLSAVFAVITVPVVYGLASEIRGKKIARIATLLFTLNFYFIFYAQMARGYSLSLLLVSLANLFFIKFVKDTSSSKYLFLNSIFFVLAIYSHLLTGLILIVQYMVLLLLPKPLPLRNIITNMIATSILLLPLVLAPAFIGSHQLDWLQKPYWFHLPMGVITLGGDSILLASLGVSVIALLLWKSRNLFFKQTMDRFVLGWLVLWSGFPILFSFLFSLTVKPIYEPNYFSTSLPAFILLISIGISQINNKILRRFILILLILFSVLRLVAWYSGEKSQHVVIDNYNPRDWKNSAIYIVDNSEKNDAVIFYAYYIRPPFEYYLKNTNMYNRLKLIEISSNQYALGGGTVLPEPNIRLIDNLSIQNKRIWLILSYNEFSWLGRKQQWQKIEKELNKFYIVTSDKKFDLIEIKLYERK